MTTSTTLNVQDLSIQAAITCRMMEIRTQIDSLDLEGKLSMLENLELFFYKQLARAQHALNNAAVMQARILLAAVKKVTVGVEFYRD